MTHGTSAHGGGVSAGWTHTGQATILVSGAGPDPLLAQMQHALRTPLNAMIGFSEAMLHELHGPLGHARYRDYAAHIGESGGRLLKAAEDALAVAETLAGLLAERRALPSVRLPMTALVQEVWAAAEQPGRGVRLCVEGPAASAIACDREATGRALHNLLAAACAETAPGRPIAVRGSCPAGSQVVEIVEIVVNAEDRSSDGRAHAGDSLRLMLARSLLEMQSATLAVSAAPTGTWCARIVFPPASHQAGPQRASRPLSAAAGWSRRSRRTARRARRADFAAAAAAAARASAGSRAAHPP
jgi:signal transduction histidine kinase